MVSAPRRGILPIALYVRNTIDITAAEEMDEVLKYFPGLSRRQIELLELYRDQLLLWNTRINLISRQDTKGVVVHHILHSLAIVKCFDFPPGTKILDLGTGGGLPGIPLAIYFPSCHFTLIDSRGKKIMAVTSIADHLGLKNVAAVHTRVEDFEGDFDYVVSRAVGSMTQLWNWSKKFLVSTQPTSRTMNIKFLLHPMGHGGKHWTRGLIILKGGSLSEELDETKRTGKAGLAGLALFTISINEFFKEPYFEEKHIVFIGVPSLSTYQQQTANSK